MRSVGWRAYALPPCLLSVAVVYWVVIAVVSVANIPSRGSDADFAHFYAAARAVRMGLGPEIYSPTLIERIDRLPGGCAGTSLQIPYLNPPLLAVLFQPLTALPCGDAFRLWRLLSLTLWAGVTLLLAWQVWQRCAARGAAPLRTAMSAAFIVALSAFSYTVLDGLWLGQVHLLVLAGIVLAGWLHTRDRPVAAGMVLAFITLIKLVPAVLLLYFLLRRDWRLLAGAALGGVLLLGVLLLGAGGLPTLLAMIGPLTSAAGLLPQDNKAVVRLNPVLGPVLVAVAATIFVLVMLLMHRKSWPKEDPALGYAWAVSTMLLVSPIVWLHYLTWLLPAVAACIPYVRGRLLPLAVGAASAFILLSRPELLYLVPAAVLVCWCLTGALYVRSMDPLYVKLGKASELLAGWEVSGKGSWLPTARPFPRDRPSPTALPGATTDRGSCLEHRCIRLSRTRDPVTDRGRWR